MKILLLEDDTVLANILIDYLQEEHEVMHAYTMKDVLNFLEKESFDVYVFDINVPDGDGISLLKELRSFSDTTPTIFITAFHDTKYLKLAFESGANDFIKKPFDLEELGQRLENIKRHFGLGLMIQLTSSVEFNTQTHLLISQQTQQTLRPKESACLQYLYQNRHRVVSTDELLQNIWNYEDMPSDDAIRTIIKELRKLLGKEHIVNVRGVGYRFE
jgi:two-component system, OmpR family, response regulator